MICKDYLLQVKNKMFFQNDLRNCYKIYLKLLFFIKIMNIKLSIIVLVTFLTPTLCRILPKSDSDADSLLLIPKEPYLYQ